MPKKKSTYKVAHVDPPEGVCCLADIENVDAWPHMQAGVPQGGDFPEDATYRMDPDFDTDIKLADALKNQEYFLVLSQKFVDLLKSLKALKHNEVHEVTVLNHKGRKVKDKYFIVHQIDNQPCVDETATVGRKSTIDTATYSTITKLVLDESKIGSDYAVFRPSQYTDRAFFRSDIAEAIEEAGLTGIEFFDVAEYDNY